MVASKPAQRTSTNRVTIGVQRMPSTTKYAALSLGTEAAFAGEASAGGGVRGHTAGVVMFGTGVARACFLIRR